jgi:hypothetical protein
MKPGSLTIAACALVAAFALGMVVEYGIMRPNPTNPEIYAPASRQTDGSLVLERKPQADAKPAHQIPKGSKMERVVQVVVQPRDMSPKSDSGTSCAAQAGTNGSVHQDDGNLPSATFCPPVRVDLSLVRMSDDSRRVIASSPDGEVLGGVDIPVEVPDRPRVLRWSTGGSWNPGDRTYGAWALRDVGPFVLGAHVFQVRRDTIFLAPAKWSGQVMVGLRF